MCRRKLWRIGSRDAMRRYRGVLRSSVSFVTMFLAFASIPLCASAVVTTGEPTGKADTVYVAGAPDWYPIEYYDEESLSYEGILPNLLDHITEKTGLAFTYVEAGVEDQRQLLAENKQVEMISGCRTDEVWIREAGLTASDEILSMPGENGKDIGVCFAFTEIADEALIRDIEQAISEMSAKELSWITIHFFAQQSKEPQQALTIVLAVVAAILLAVTILLAVKLCRYLNASVQNECIDPLTGIWNKSYFVDFFEHYISNQYRNLYCVAYVAFDIGRVNKYYGELAAEEQLRFAASELKLSTRDNELAARISGGGFAVVRLGSGEQQIKTWIEQLLERLNKYTDRYGKDFHPLFRAGIYRLKPTDRCCETVLFNARQGYQQSVERNVLYTFARTEQLKRENEKLQLKKHTLDALQNREFQMYIQLVVRAENGEICGGEAVSRWYHPRNGLLFPNSYIDLMEAEGTIAELDFYIFEEVCRQLENWKKEGRRLSLSCNFARITIGQPDFAQRIEKIAGSFSFDYELLIIEITEDAMESNKQVAFSNISRCKDMGFCIALDDAGNGYTSFADLRDYPIDVVKIDRSILNSAGTPRGSALLRGITSLVHDLDMSVLGEGAETKVQVDMLKEIGCDYIQGYYFYRPLPLEEVKHILKEK